VFVQLHIFNQLIMAPMDGSFVAGAIRSLTKRIRALETELLVKRTSMALYPTARSVFNPDAPEFVPCIPPGILVHADPLVPHTALERAEAVVQELLQVPHVVPQDAVCAPPVVPVVVGNDCAEALLHECHERDLRVHQDVNACADCADDDEDKTDLSANCLRLAERLKIQLSKKTVEERRCALQAFLVNETVIAQFAEGADCPIDEVRCLLRSLLAELVDDGALAAGSQLSSDTDVDMPVLVPSDTPIDELDSMYDEYEDYLERNGWI